MFDPNSSSFVYAVLGLIVLCIGGAGVLSWSLAVQLPRMRLRRVERQAAAGDPEAIRSVRFLEDLDSAFRAGSPQDAERRNELRLKGRKVRAEIRSVTVGSTRTERGTTAMRPVTMTLGLLDEDRELTVTEFVDELYVARLLIGAEVTVFIDPLDPAALTVGWDMV
jgi:hypothetical protein